MDATHDRIISQLGQGFSQAVVAAACGVSPSYISQVVNEEGVREQIATFRAKKLKDAVEVDDTIEELERKTLTMLGQRLPMVRTAGELAKIFSTLNAAKKKIGAQGADSDASSVQQVNITLPKSASVMISLNNNNQVIAIEGQTMAPLPSRALPSLVSTLAGKQVGMDTAMDVTDKLVAADKANAKEVLRKVADIEILVDGVLCVL